MSTVSRQPEADPLYAAPLPRRAAYATGMLLDAQDFLDEQTYHRGRLARALAFLAGGGTLAGLKVAHRAADAKHPEEIQVQPGVAVDRLGRLVEIPRPACLRLDPWFAGENDRDGGDTLKLAALDNLQRVVGIRVDPSGALPARAVVADVFLRFVACENGLTPSFAAGPFDALDAVSAARVRDAYELHMIARTDISKTKALGDEFCGLPDQGPDLARLGDIAARRAKLQDEILAAYPARGRAGRADAIEPPPGHPRNLDPTAVFLARVLIPVGAVDPPKRDKNQSVRVDNFSRRFVPTATLIGRWIDAAGI